MEEQKIDTETTEKIKGITGSGLKWIAVITMFIDHMGASVIRRILYADPAFLNSNMHWNSTRLAIIYHVMRCIGRIAFPIFCFLLVEGYGHTKNKMSYVLRLLGFAIISEIPFDLNFNGKILEFSSQNVFFTLCIGVLCMWLYQYIEEDFRLPYLTRTVLGISVVALGMLLAMEMRTDYGASGVFCIMMLYLLQKNKKFQMIGGIISFGVMLFPTEIPAMFAFLPIYFYNGKRGKQIKYFFYFFYPLHLMLLYIICIVLGISRYHIY